MKDEATDLAAEVVEKGTEAAAYVAGEAMECACAGAKVAVDVAGKVVGTALGSLVRIFGPSD